MAGAVKKKKVVGAFEYCESCDYKGSFHIFIDMVTTEDVNNARLLLKCPSCEQVYDVNLHCTIK